MVPFGKRFPELGATETRFVKVLPQPDLPGGEYSFVEFYCDEPGCDCRRVIIQVLRPETGWSKVWATIGYGWGERVWTSIETGSAATTTRLSSLATDMKGPYLDPLQPTNPILTLPFWICFKSCLSTLPVMSTDSNGITPSFEIRSTKVRSTKESSGRFAPTPPESTTGVSATANSNAATEAERTDSNSFALSRAG